MHYNGSYASGIYRRDLPGLRHSLGTFNPPKQLCVMIVSIPCTCCSNPLQDILVTICVCWYPSVWSGIFGDIHVSFCDHSCDHSCDQSGIFGLVARYHWQGEALSDIFGDNFGGQVFQVWFGDDPVGGVGGAVNGASAFGCFWQFLLISGYPCASSFLVTKWHPGVIWWPSGWSNEIHWFTKLVSQWA